MKYPDKREFHNDALKDFAKFVGTQEQIDAEKARRIVEANENYYAALKAYREYEYNIRKEKIDKIKKEYGFIDKRYNDIIYKAAESICDDEDKEEIFQIIAVVVRDILKLNE